MAECGSGPYSSCQIASTLGKQVTSLGPVRSQLISKGLIYSPAYGETAVTVPLFDAFMKRMMKTF